MMLGEQIEPDETATIDTTLYTYNGRMLVPSCVVSIYVDPVRARPMIQRA